MDSEQEIRNRKPASKAADCCPIERQIYTPQQLAAERWQCSYELVLEHIQSRRLRAFNAGKGRRPLWRIPLSAVLAFENGLPPQPSRSRRRLSSSSTIKRY